MCVCRLRYTCRADYICSPLCFNLLFVPRQAPSWEKTETGPNTHASFTDTAVREKDWHTVGNTLTPLLHPCLSFSLTAPWLLDCIQRFCRAALRAVRPSVELPCWACCFLELPSLMTNDLCLQIRHWELPWGRGEGGFNSVKCSVIWTEFKKGTGAWQ